MTTTTQGSDTAGYDEAAIAAARRLKPRTFDQRFELFKSLDPNFAKIWSGYTGTLLGREGVLSVRDRILILTGQYTILGDLVGLEDVIRAGIEQDDVDLKQQLEVIFQIYVYAGESKMAEAVEVFARVVGEAGRLDEVKARGLSINDTADRANLEDERKQWSKDDTNDPRVPRLLDRLGWLGMSNAMRQRPKVMVNTIDLQDALDTEFDAAWLEAIYGGMYRRDVLDPRIRALCVVGNFFVIGETFQSTRHMRVALRHGVKPAELLELLFQSVALVGHPHVVGIAVDDVVRVIDDEGQLDEIVDPDRQEKLRELVNARAASRGTIGAG